MPAKKKAEAVQGWHKDSKTYKSGCLMYRLLYDGECIVEANEESTIDYLLAKRKGAE